MGKSDEYVSINALVDPDVKERAKQNTAHGEITEQIRELFRALAEGDEFTPDLDEAIQTPEERYGDLDGGEQPSDWRRRREKVLLRDDYECRNCSKKGGLDGPAELVVHHIVPAKAGGSHEVRNLVALCEDCHYDAHHSY